jgi:uncharacterized membrane protein
MASSWFLILCEIAVIGCGVVAGLFLTFSDIIMRSLNLAKPSAGIEVMQIINHVILRSIMMIFLWGMVALTVGLASYAYVKVPGPVSNLLAAGGTFYFVGVLIISYLFNIPMNNRLAAMDSTQRDTATYWADTYVPRWTFWNHIRTASSLGSTVCFLIACIWLIQQSVAT